MGGPVEKIFRIEILQQIKKNYSLVPIFAIAVFGMSLSAFAIFRTVSRSPDVIGQWSGRSGGRKYRRMKNVWNPLGKSSCLDIYAQPSPSIRF